MEKIEKDGKTFEKFYLTGHDTIIIGLKGD